LSAIVIDIQLVVLLLLLGENFRWHFVEKQNNHQKFSNR
jgi:hypothetical protein